MPATAQSKARKNKKVRKGQPQKIPKQPETQYRRELLSIVAGLKNDIKNRIIPLLRTFEAEYVGDTYAGALSNAFDELRSKYENAGIVSKMVATSFVGNANKENKRRFYRSLESTLGVDLYSVVRSENIEDILLAKTRENVSLIKSIPEEYFKKIETLVFTGTTQGLPSTSLIKEIMKIGKVTEKRAKLIARDQSSKINSALTKQRQTNLGIEEYIWVTSKDERVRETHKKNNGKRFRWDTPPTETGHPGNDIQCRCIAQPIIQL